MKHEDHAHILSTRAVTLKRRPSGLPRAEDFAVIDVPASPPGDGEVLVRNRYSRVSASLRMMISQGAENVEGVPFPALRPGDLLAEETLGEVIATPRDSALSVGDLVLHHAGWREIATVPIAGCVRVDDDLPEPAAHLAHGWTAYAALTRGAHVRAGDTVFVTSAAGAIGSMAGQIARLLGATRVIGSTSTLAKADRLVRELGYDAAVIREDATPFAAQLASAAPDGIDVLLDNVGGEQLQAAIATARPGARCVLVGALSGQLAREGTGRTAPVELDSFQLLLRKITLRGYSADDDPEVRHEWTRRFGDWLRAGTITFPHVIIAGIEHGPQALQRIAEGHYFGTVLIQF